MLNNLKPLAKYVLLVLYFNIFENQSILDVLITLDTVHVKKFRQFSV